MTPCPDQCETQPVQYYQERAFSMVWSKLIAFNPLSDEGVHVRPVFGHATPDRAGARVPGTRADAGSRRSASGRSRAFVQGAFLRQASDPVSANLNGCRFRIHLGPDVDDSLRPNMLNLQTEDTFQTLATWDSFGPMDARLMSTHLLAG